MGIAELILLLLLPSSMALLISVAGLLVNLAKPKLDFVNETVVIKQSISTFLVMLIGMSVVIAAVVPYFLLHITNVLLYGAVVTVLLIAACAALIRVMSTWGVRKFERLNG